MIYLHFQPIFPVNSSKCTVYLPKSFLENAEELHDIGRKIDGNVEAIEHAGP
jgi:hypothetical protein